MGITRYEALHDKIFRGELQVEILQTLGSVGEILPPSQFSPDDDVKTSAKIMELMGYVSPAIVFMERDRNTDYGKREMTLLAQGLLYIGAIRMTSPAK